MTENTTTFNGQRLRVARFFRGQSQEDVGNALGISQQFIGDVERGVKTPSDEVVRALGDLLGFESEFFFGPSLIEFLDSECNFRRRRTTPISIRGRALAYGTLFGQFWSFATEKLVLHSSAIPAVAVISGRAEIDKAAEWCRRKWGLDPDAPIGNMMRVIEKAAGVPVARFGDVGEKVDAFSRAGQPSVVVLSNKPASKCRSDLAHECGHLVLHRNKPTGIPETEREADRFARAFLLPANGFRREFPRSLTNTWETLFALKRRWKASLVDIIQRARDLSLINQVQYLRLYKELSRQGWLKAEPYEFEHEAPELVPKVFEQLKISGIEQADIARALGWTSETLVEITGVANERKSQGLKATVRTLPTRRREG